MKEGKCDEAIECYNKAVELDWTNAVYLCNRYRRELFTFKGAC